MRDTYHAAVSKCISGDSLVKFDKVWFVKGCDCRFENVVAKVVADRRLVLETWKECTQDTHVHDDRPCIADVNRGVAEKENGFEDGWCGENELAHGWAIDVAAAFDILAGKLCSGVSEGNTAYNAKKKQI